MFANIIVDISHEKLDRPSDTSYLKNLKINIRRNSRNDSFGRGNRLISGYVIEITDTPGLM